MTRNLGLSFAVVFCSFSVFASESYTCEITEINAKTGVHLKNEKKTFDLENFRTSCENKPCKSQKHIYGGEKGDLFSFSLIAHNGKPPVVAVMIMSFTLTSQVPGEGNSLAGTDYGSRLYTQVNAGETDIFVECRYSETEGSENILKKYLSKMTSTLKGFW